MRVITSLIEQRGSVAALHAADPFGAAGLDAPQVWWCRPDDDAIVLGSRQTSEVIDPGACAAAGLAVVRRRSGGGLVVIRRAAMIWIDLVLPHGVAPDDVRGAMVWAGERWRDALVAIAGFDAGDLTVHRGGMESSTWSDLVCFAGIGPGEVLLDGRKLVGLSQRRTRHGIRVQGLVHTASPTSDLLAVVPEPRPSGAPPEPALAALDGAIAAGAIAAFLTARITPE